jgi:hypothetical protein
VRHLLVPHLKGRRRLSIAKSLRHPETVGNELIQADHVGKTTKEESFPYSRSHLLQVMSVQVFAPWRDLAEDTIPRGNIRWIPRREPK